MLLPSARTRFIRAMVAKVQWPLEEGEEVEAYFRRMVLNEELPKPTLKDADAFEEVRLAGLRRLLLRLLYYYYY